jgi:hypothetical protein
LGRVVEYDVSVRDGNIQDLGKYEPEDFGDSQTAIHVDDVERKRKGEDVYVLAWS